MYDLRQIMIGFIIAVVIYLISVFASFGLIGGLIGFFIGGFIANYRFRGSWKNGVVNGLLVGLLGWAIVYFVMINVFNVSTDIIGDYSLLIPQENFLSELWVSLIYILVAVIGGIAGSIRR